MTKKLSLGSKRLFVADAINDGDPPTLKVPRLVEERMLVPDFAKEFEGADTAHGNKLMAKFKLVGSPRRKSFKPCRKTRVKGIVTS